jgi:hypothetical protein
MVDEVFENCYNLNPITSVKTGHFQGILLNYLEPDLELEPEEIFRLHNTLIYNTCFSTSVYTECTVILNQNCDRFRKSEVSDGIA